MKNARILSGYDLELVKGFVRIVDGEIREIERGHTSKDGIDLKGSILMPPFVNAHTHVGDSVAKDIYAGRTQPEVVGGGGYKFRALSQSSREEKIGAIRNSLLEMRNSGSIAHLDFREGGMEGLSQLKDAEIPDLKSFSLTRPSDGTDIEELLSESDGIGVPSLESYSMEKLETISELVSSHDKLLSFHVSETKSAHETSLDETGQTEIERALAFDPNFLIHGVWAETEDLRALSEEDVSLVMCPRSNSLLSTGVPPIREALDEGVELWLGTDNVSVCSPIMFHELSFAWTMLRLQDERAGETEAKELLKAATVNPLKELDLKAGPLMEGKTANFLIISPDRNLRKTESLYLGLVNRCRAGDIESIVS
ncbi:hypothetical protein AKJ51_05075 [candidate division MSBL1 archaeon SCGC-AAA382A20]|uniref:Amidohydrolase-related domain-containing protein n=1 Tax=candidate division MSBL1 archaeon SCGC-AAA382A20 TaxID=1698280 RepID=A0A133VG47_9EURY|nr:hypothetical protein AKJ51_05075 [candidate division MSBL1 archaeon SCGC-AAA382A20]